MKENKSSKVVLSVENLCYKYEDSENYILENINFDIYEKEFVSIIGPNGGGKSTLIKLVLGLLKPSSGLIKFFNNLNDKSKPKIGYVPQYINFDNLYPISALDVVLMGRLKSNFFYRFNKKDYEIAKSCIKQVGMDGFERKLIANLSGGQRQRILIARALAVESPILILDEPTANLDKEAQIFLYELLKKLNEEKTIILVSHDIGFVPSISTKVLCLNRFSSIYSKQSEKELENIDFYNCKVDRIININNKNISE